MRRNDILRHIDRGLQENYENLFFNLLHGAKFGSSMPTIFSFSLARHSYFSLLSHFLVVSFVFCCWPHFGFLIVNMQLGQEPFHDWRKSAITSKL
jgi:hypothetical protein